MSDTADLNAELLAAIPPDMHPYAYAFMHVQFPGVLAKFEPDELNALGRHIERLGFRPTEQQLDRYEPPKSGPIHPHNPGKWVPIASQATGTPADQRAEFIASLARTAETEEGGS
ncbi:hypothetical protein GS436_02810 [Rhodococcus hoagii]|uniref:Uncharacterized protein n=1 Tax=Rhodococcus hoagii TaxID=43767 RepID=A0AAE3B9R6_RHOHA|nr:hypothetical protein [Prescottella equi]MBM4492585.1 hypothetical protein [Prescottella equi]MBM4580932.1 hypothetical protein [Prescottella equi]MBM4707114.1 hypothetical protein [Prescottella equi]MBM4713653.1 hypothetical protein [Prescottella equi]MCU7527397.1 hypothetical protein [Prescottella equi]